MAQHQYHQVLQVDEVFDDDSAYDDGADLISATTTLRSSITDFYYLHGRRYNAYRAGQYWGPNDEKMAEVHDIGHHCYSIMMDGKLHLAPLDRPRRAMDVGTGTGIWAVDFADTYPDCQVIGTDLSPIQPLEVPPNLQFEIDDACDEWTYTRESFDYVHVRGMYGSVADWPRFYAEVLKHLRPGGWYEQLEISLQVKSDDGTVLPGTPLTKFGPIMLKGGEAFGKTFAVADEQRQRLVAAGFQDVSEHRWKLPIGPWNRDRKLKELGQYNRLFWTEGLQGWCLWLLTRCLGWSYEEVEVYLAEVRRMLLNKSIHGYHDCSVIIGRKPFR